MLFKQNLTAYQKKKLAFKRGLRAEKYAGWLLRLKGYKILAHRYKTPCGEIDLIARRKDLVLIVEVKARDKLTEGAEALSLQSQRRIKAATQYWLARQKGYEELCIRFDLIVCCPKKWPAHFMAFFTDDYC